jgi:hypothetical protein
MRAEATPTGGVGVCPAHRDEAFSESISHICELQEGRMRTAVRSAVMLAALLLPTMASAQASLAGVVKDASGAVLPGVTVEAASPALIEKTRAVVTDGGGTYKIENLRPGAYTVTFTLTGFNAFKRDGVELTGTQTVNINAELKVGAVAETITVTGETPVVDIQSTTKQTVFDRALIDSLPIARTNAGVGALVAGTIANRTDVGGSNPEALGAVSVHGLGDQRVMVNGVTTGTLMGGQSVDMSFRNPAASQEVAFDTAAVSADGATGGTRINYIPRDGGNTFKGNFFGTYSNSSLQGSNFTQRVKDLGLVAVNANKRNWDYNPAFGGPIVKDKVWFWATGRSQVGDVLVGGIFFNKNTGNPNAWTYVPDTSQQAYSTGTWWDAQVRVTWQANPKNKFAVVVDRQNSDQDFWGVGQGTTPGATNFLAPEAAGHRPNPVQSFYHAEWTAPITSRLLLEGVVVNRHELWGNMEPPGGLKTQGFIPVTAQDTNLKYRGPGQAQFGGAFNRSSNPDTAYRFTLSYVTGAHAVKVGWNDQIGHLDHQLYQYTPLQYRVNNSTQAIPNQLTELAFPLNYNTNLDHDAGLYAQDRWAIKRATITGALRFDWFKTSYPAQQAIPGLLFPNRNTQYPASDFINWKDLEPRVGLVYDVFGTGKTAARVTINKYLFGLGLNGLATDANPINAVATSTTRTWTDNGDYVVNCDLLNPGAQDNRTTGADFCGAMTTPAFVTGGAIASFSNNLITGWGHRGYNWEFSAGVQQEIMPRMSVDIAYFRRIFGNFRVTDNILTAPSDYTQFSVTAPVDSRLPGGGGNTISGVFDVNPNKAGQVNNLNELVSDIGANQIRHWDGVDITARLRPRNAQIGASLSLGRQLDDNCEVVAKIPELPATPAGTATGPVFSPTSFCHQTQALQTIFKLNGAYILPKIDVLVSGSFGSMPGPQITSAVIYPNAIVAPALGRSLSSNATNIQVNVVAPQSMYGERLNQLDLRFGKVLRFDRYRVTPSIDIYNALNTDAILTQSNNFANWQQAQAILTARFVKFSVQFDF